MFENSKRLTLKSHFRTRSFLLLIVMMVAQIDGIDQATTILNSDELKTFNRFYHPLREYINYFANLLDAKKQPMVDKSIFFHITSGYSTGIVSLNSRYGIILFEIEI